MGFGFRVQGITLRARVELRQNETANSADPFGYGGAPYRFPSDHPESWCPGAGGSGSLHVSFLAIEDFMRTLGFDIGGK